ncbi:MAG TPA: hypothetical protein VGF75_02715 [Candidatus Saccharimonadales bacterium]|jgi:hypothetical protein
MKKAKVELTEEQIIYLLEVVGQQELSFEKSKVKDGFVKFVRELKSNLADTESALNAARA